MPITGITHHHSLLLFDIEQQSFLNENALISVMSYP
jgi:hypothetical protein